MKKKKKTIKTAKGKSKKSGSAKKGGKAKKKRGQTRTYGLSIITSAITPFTLPIRQPGWFPDGADIGTTKRKRLFLEEVAGITQTDMLVTFPVEFDYKGTSKKWILGSRISDSEGSFTKFVRRLAVKIRQYNASLYRLRRLHFYWDHQARDPRLVTFPKANPHGDPKTNPDPINDLPGFKKMAKAAEADWTKVSNQVNDLLETASSGSSSFGIELLAADMVAANGYIVSMRVVANEPSENGGPASPGIAAPEVGGSSSSHVSISSAFSSSSQSSRF